MWQIWTLFCLLDIYEFPGREGRKIYTRTNQNHGKWKQQTAGQEEKSGNVGA